MPPAIKPTAAARNDTMTMRKPAGSSRGAVAVLTPVTPSRVFSSVTVFEMVAGAFGSAILGLFPPFISRAFDARKQLFEHFEQLRSLIQQLRTMIQRDRKSVV